MGYVLKLKKGGKSLDLSSGNYAVDQWVPPRANIISNIASGTSANRYGGGVKVSERAVNTSTVFSVRILGSSNAECEAGARRIENFLRQAGDETEPTYLEWRPDNNIGFETQYGQWGANIRYEVVSGMVDRWNAYFVSQLRNTVMFINVMLELKPFAIGKRQRLFSALGNVQIDTIGQADGDSRGIQISYGAGTNKMTNPVFGHATYNNGWTAGAQIIAAENTDPNFYLFGGASAKLVCVGAGTRIFYQGIDVGNTNNHTLSFYAKRQDGAAVDANTCAVWYASEQTSTYESVGNGWYRVRATFAGIASSQAAGVIVATNYTVFVDAFKLEESANAYPFFYGDMLGCAWSGTAHASTSTRGTPYCRIATSEVINLAEGTVALAFRPQLPSSAVAVGGYVYLFDAGATCFRLYFRQSDTTFGFTDGTNTIVSSAQSWSLANTYIFHVIWKPGSLKIYLNGAEIATGTTYNPPALSSYFYLGSNATPGEWLNATFTHFASYARAMSATEVLNDYANISKLADDDKKISDIPWIWTKDGDDVVDNCNDSGRDNFAVVGGIAGDVRAETEYRLAMSNIAARQAIIGIMTHNYGGFVNPDDYLYGEQDGTADGGSSNGEYYTKSSVSTSTTLIGPSSTTLSQRGVEALLGRDIYMMARLYDASASTLQLAIYRPGFYSGSVYEWHNNTMPATTWGLHRTDAVSLPTKAELLQTLVYSERSISNKAFGLYGRHVSGTSDVRIDFWAIMPRPMAILGDGDAVSGAGWVLNGRKIINMDSTFATLYKRAAMSGDTLDLFPNQLNVLVSLLGYASDATISRTLTYTVYVTPRWSLA